MPEIFFSIDVEADGPIPGRNSMLSLGCAAFVDNLPPIGGFYRKLEALPEASCDPDTMAWWSLPAQAEAYAEATRNPQHPAVVMYDFAEWVGFLCAERGAKPVCVAYPAGFDFMFVYWYFRAHGIESPFSFSCLDMKSYAMAKLGTEYRYTTKRNMPKAWFFGLPAHNHNAYDDAVEQGMLFMRMRAHKA